MYEDKGGDMGSAHRQVRHGPRHSHVKTRWVMGYGPYGQCRSLTCFDAALKSETWLFCEKEKLDVDDGDGGRLAGGGQCGRWGGLKGRCLCLNTPSVI